MKNINHIKYLTKSTRLSSYLFFVQLLLVIFIIIIYYSYSSTLTVTFSILIGISSTISFSCAIAIIVFTFLIKINGEKEPELIIFSILNFFLFIISPIVFHILANKYINAYNKEILSVQGEKIDLKTNEEKVSSFDKKDTNGITSW